MSEEITLDAVGRRYPIQKEVGRGGMSVVYEATDPRIGRRVAVKLLHPHLASRADARRRFLQEATAIARLENPHILKVYDYDSPDDQTSYIISEFVEGATLKQWVELNPIKHWEIVALIALPLFRALAHAHQQKIIHRDVKPENIMIRAKSGAPVLMDFGIAHIIDSETLTATGAMIGSPAHMAPEVVNGEPLTCGADLFSMGTVLYWMTCGSLPFVAPNPAALFRRILEVRFDPVKERRPEVLSDFAKLIEQCMQRDPEQRPESASAIAERLEELLAYAGLYEHNDLLAELSHDPGGFQASLPERLTSSYCERAAQAIKEDRLTLALELIERAYLFESTSPQVLQVRNRVQRAMRQRRSIRFSLMSLLAMLFGAGVMLWLGGTPSQGVTRSDIAQGREPQVGLVGRSGESSTSPSGTSPQRPDSPISSEVASSLTSKMKENERTLTSPGKSPVDSKTTSDQDPNALSKLKQGLKKKFRGRVSREVIRPSARLRDQAAKLKRKSASRSTAQNKAQLTRIADRRREEAKSAQSSKRVKTLQRVKVSSRYKGAQIWVNGASVGHVYQLDTSGGIELTVGERHEIVFRSPFCEERRRTLFFEKALPQKQVVFECTYKPATIMIRSVHNAEVFLDGPQPRLLGRTNQVITYPLATTGKDIRLILMSAEGRSERMKLSLEAGQRREVTW